MADKDLICCETCAKYWSGACTGEEEIAQDCNEYEEYDAKASEYYYFGEPD